MTDTTKITTAPPDGNAGLLTGIWPIRSAIALANAVDTCRMTGQIGLVTGPSGIGKTTAARAIVAALEDRLVEARYVMMTRAADGLQPGLLRIARAIGAAANPNMGGADIYDAVVSHIARLWDGESVLVLDEAQFMSEALIDALRNISDEMRGHHGQRGIVMVGTSELADRFAGRLGGRAKHHEPLTGRLFRLNLDGLSAEDLETITGALGVGGAGTAELVAKVVAGRGRLHNLARVLDMARRIGGRSKPLSYAHLMVAVDGLGVNA